MAQALRDFGQIALEAVEDFASGKTIEPALDAIPAKTLQGFLNDLRDKLKEE